MKKLFWVVLSIFVFFAAFILEGGYAAQLVGPDVFIPLTLGVLSSTLFSFSFSELVNTFKDCFSEDESSNNLNNYHMGLLIVKNLESATLFWSWTLVIMATILILSNLTTPDKLGPSFAVAFLSLLYGYGTKAALFIPMKNSLHKKILSLQENN